MAWPAELEQGNRSKINATVLNVPSGPAERCCIQYEIIFLHIYPERASVNDGPLRSHL